MKTENEWKSEWVKQVRKEGAYARRIEDKYSVGFPDLIVQPLHYGLCFIEAKLVKGRYFEPTARQLRELQQLDVHAGHFSLILGYDEEIRTFYIAQAEPAPAREQKIDTRTCWASADTFINVIRKFIDEQRPQNSSGTAE